MDVRKFSTFIITLGLVFVVFGGLKIAINNAELEDDKKEYAALIERIAGKNSGISEANLNRVIGRPSGYLGAIEKSAQSIEIGKYIAIAGLLVSFLGIALRISSKPSSN